jgi:predicted nucleotidyltransferase
VDFDPELYARAIRGRNEAERLFLAERRQQALAEAQRLARLIKQRVPGVERVILFGSVAEDNVKSADFDIDLAIVGGDSYRAEDVAAESPFKIDIADFARLPGHIRTRILERGMELK